MYSSIEPILSRLEIYSSFFYRLYWHTALFVYFNAFGDILQCIFFVIQGQYILSLLEICSTFCRLWRICSTSYEYYVYFIAFGDIQHLVYFIAFSDIQKYLVQYSILSPGRCDTQPLVTAILCVRVRATAWIVCRLNEGGHSWVTDPRSKHQVLITVRFYLG